MVNWCWIDRSRSWDWDRRRKIAAKSWRIDRGRRKIAKAWSRWGWWWVMSTPLTMCLMTLNCIAWNSRKSLHRDLSMIEIL
jgi:hypothetical protein